MGGITVGMVLVVCGQESSRSGCGAVWLCVCVWFEEEGEEGSLVMVQDWCLCSGSWGSPPPPAPSSLSRPTRTVHLSSPVQLQTCRVVVIYGDGQAALSTESGQVHQRIYLLTRLKGAKASAKQRLRLRVNPGLCLRDLYWGSLHIVDIVAVSAPCDVPSPKPLY